MPLSPPPPRNQPPSSVAHVAVLVPDDPQEVEAEGQQGSAQQVPQGRQVRDGEAVRVFAAPPHGMDHPVGNAQQQQHLEEVVEKVWGWASQRSLNPEVGFFPGTDRLDGVLASQTVERTDAH